MTNYEIDFSGLTGEEMITLDEIFGDILTVNSDDPDFDIFEKVEPYHQKRYNEYLKNHPEYVRHFDGTYESDKAWMFAETAVLNWERNQITNEMIWNSLMGKGSDMDDEYKTVWDKVVTEKEENNYSGPDYSCCDRYDFSMLRH